MSHVSWKTLSQAFFYRKYATYVYWAQIPVVKYNLSSIFIKKCIFCIYIFITIHGYYWELLFLTILIITYLSNYNILHKIFISFFNNYYIFLKNINNSFPKNILSRNPLLILSKKATNILSFALPVLASHTPHINFLSKGIFRRTFPIPSPLTFMA